MMLLLVSFVLMFSGRYDILCVEYIRINIQSFIWRKETLGV